MKYFEWILGIIVLLALVYANFRNSKDRTSLAIRYAVSLPFFIGLIWILRKVYLASGPGGPGLIGIVAIVYGVLCAVVFSILWTPTLTEIIIKPLTSAFDGGDDEAEATPCYSVIEAKKAAGAYPEALLLIREQLVKFPNDFMLVITAARIQVENMSDFTSALAILEKHVHLKSTEKKEVLYCLNLMADWHLKYSKDIQAARSCFQRIINDFPNSEPSDVAAQRIAHIAGTEYLLESELRTDKKVGHRERDLGLKKPLPGELPQEENMELVAGNYELHLEQHPLDTEAREHLAMIYARNLGRPEMALAQLEHLICSPHQQAKKIVHWLNLVTDVQIKNFRNIDAARAALQRIVAINPAGAAADAAHRRQHLLKVELRELETTSEVTMKTYEKDLGLRSSTPARRRAQAELEERKRVMEARQRKEQEGDKDQTDQMQKRIGLDLG